MPAARGVLCPYCFETWSTSLGAFRCLGSPTDPECPRVPDEAQARLLGGDPALQKKVVVRRARFGREFEVGKGGTKCDCGARTTPVCPCCHSALPHGYAEGGDRLIGMIGTKASGKSHYIAVLIHELFQGIGARLDAVVELLDDDTRTRYEADLVRLIYDEGVALPGSMRAKSEGATVQRPLGLRLTFSDGKRRSAVNAVFFDTAGEDLLDDSVLEREARYIGQCAALILLADPLQVPSIRDLVGTTVPLPDLIAEPLDVLRSVTALVRRQRGVPEGTPLDQPLAIAFSKLDAIRGLFDGDSPVLSEPPSNGAYDASEARWVGGLLRAQMIEWLGPAFDEYVTANYRSANYFGVSALGAQPDPGGTLARDVAPHRVADPLLWILGEWKALPTR